MVAICSTAWCVGPSSPSPIESCEYINMEGISIKGRTVLIYSANDQAGAWSRNKLGDWNYDVMAGGYRQRQLSIRLGINIILYALTLDYKKDMVHLPIILERLRRYQSP